MKAAAAGTLEGFFTIDSTRRVVQWGDGAANLLGLPAERALGLYCHEAVHGREDRHPSCPPLCPAFKELERGRLSGRSIMLVRRDGSGSLRLTCELTALPNPPGGAVARLYPVIARSSPGKASGGGSLSADAGLPPGMVRDLCALAKLTSSLSVASPENGLSATLEIVREATGAEAAEVFLAEPGGLGMVLTAHCGLFRKAFFEITRFGPAQGFPGLVLSSHQPVSTTALPDDPRYLRRQVVARGFRSFLSVPFFGPRGLMGTLDVAYRRPDPDLEAARRLLSWAGASLSLKLEAWLQRPLDETGTAEDGRPAWDGDGLDMVLRQLLHQAIGSGRAQGGCILLLERVGSGLARRVEEGPVPEANCAVLESDCLHECPALSGRHGVALYGPRNSWPWGCQQASHQGKVTYCLPMIARQENVGVIRIGYQKPGPTPPTQYMVKLLGIASEGAAKVRAAQDHLEERQRLEELSRLQARASTPLTEAADPGPPGSRKPVLRHESAGPEAAYLDIRCFGRFQLYRKGALVTPQMTPRRKAFTLLKVLLTFEGQPVPKDTLIELLWPETSPDTGTGRLHMVVHALRQLMEPPGNRGKWTYVRTEGDCYYFDVSSPCRLDVNEFSALVRAGRSAQAAGNPGASVRAFEAAAEIYRGDYLEDEAFTDWCWSEREHLRETCLDVLAVLASHYGQRGMIEPSIAWYRKALRLDPAREQNHQGLIRALAASGRRDEALRQYHVCREVLRRELDIAPLPETERLYLQIAHHEPLSGGLGLDRKETIVVAAPARPKAGC